MRTKRMLVALALLSSVPGLAAAPRVSQSPDKKDPGRVYVSTYRAVPGRHLELLKWLAAQDEVAIEAGIPPLQVYTHLEGVSWDFLVIRPLTTPDQDRKADEIAKRKGLKTGFAALLDFRQLAAEHTDTLVLGPRTAAEWVAEAGR